MKVTLNKQGLEAWQRLNSASLGMLVAQPAGMTQAAAELSEARRGLETVMIDTMNKFEGITQEPKLRLPLQALAGLYALATGQLTHVMMGSCPDSMEGSEVRDDECPACKLIIEIEGQLRAAGVTLPKYATQDSQSAAEEFDLVGLARAAALENAPEYRLPATACHQKEIGTPSFLQCRRKARTRFSD